MQSYGQVCADFYDADKPIADASETDFFASHIEAARGIALEAMCGSGRLLIPLLKRGLIIEGVDNSPSMLANLERRCRATGLPAPKTFQQSVATLNLKRKYPLIFIALGSLQLLSETEAKAALLSIYRHLEVGGKFLLDTFIPWDLMQSPSLRSFRRKLRCGNHLIQLESEIRVDKDEQRYYVNNQYERHVADEVKEREAEVFSVRWYLPVELTALLESVGFEVFCKGIPVTSPTPRRYLYEANRRT